MKPPAESVDDTATSAQIDKYWDRYKLVLVTNLRDWLLIGQRNGKRVQLERFSLATNEAAFWALTSHSNKAQETCGDPFADFLSRVLVHAAPLAEPRDLAFLLASYAREALYRVQHADVTAAHQLEALKNSLETSLGVTFKAEEGGHFFRSTLVQTLFYGVFSAWVLRHEQGITGTFDWRSAEYSLNVPMIAALFGQLSQPAKLKALKLTEVLDWATDALNRVDQQAFFTTFESTHAIQYFYEPFLAAFDPELRKSLGVWYTPEKIVKYQVARVDEVLQSELGIVDGLADPAVIVLDPCCGTGTYLLEVLRLITAKLKEKGADALTAHHVKTAATTRVFGFELLPAPYVVAHLQLGLLLRQFGAALSDDERARVYLTNALTGWQPAQEPKVHVLPFPEFEEERQAADDVKRAQKIIVILGNPPYDAFSGVAQGEEQNLVAPYKQDLIKKWGIKKFNLDDLYIRFFRLAERQIAEHSGRGVVSLISNYSWSSEASFVVLRQRLLQSFNSFWIENMHGNRKISEYAPDGRTSETIFAQKGFSSGIRQGVVISLWVKTGEPGNARVLYRDDIDNARAEDRREALLATLQDPTRETKYTVVVPTPQNRYSFRPSNVSVKYAQWPTVAALAEMRSDGVFEKRGGAFIDIDKSALDHAMRMYFDSAIPLEQVIAARPALGDKASGYDPGAIRLKALKEEKFDPARLVPIAVRPYDVRWAYWSAVSGLWNRSRPQLWKQFWKGNSFIVSRLTSGSTAVGSSIYYTSALVDGQVISVNPAAIPLYLASTPDDKQTAFFGEKKANLSGISRAYLKALNLPDPDNDKATAVLIWMHALAIGYARSYQVENADGIREDWPRIPLPASMDALIHSAGLGRLVADLLDLGKPIPGVTVGVIRSELKSIAVISRRGGTGPLLPSEFALTAGWGHPGREGTVMPAKGKVTLRAATSGELPSDFTNGQTLDVYLNSAAYWKNIPQQVWDLTIGGYQVIKKWLSYRERDILGRNLTTAEIQQVTEMARRLTALLLLQEQLDKNYEAIKCHSYVPGAQSASPALVGV